MNHPDITGPPQFFSSIQCQNRNKRVSSPKTLQKNSWRLHDWCFTIHLFPVVHLGFLAKAQRNVSKFARGMQSSKLGANGNCLAVISKCVRWKAVEVHDTNCLKPLPSWKYTSILLLCCFQSGFEFLRAKSVRFTTIFLIQISNH